ncbi:HD domain-containing protein [Pseudalkalibacillus sp. SCS-8]|uniref:HD domain-containing protein n=1 Tax=Pseudalkalibacillus nanhaiensis TaxID=3115291 RepID=UPI0032DAC81D
MLESIETFVKGRMQGDSTGHDWFHVDRVRKLALHIGEIERADLMICETAALVHDLIDDKLISDEGAALDEVVQLLRNNGMNSDDLDHVVEIITTMSFSSNSGAGMSTLEGKVVQDADRLDALGAIGIARTFMFAGAKSEAMYNPEIEARTGTMSKDEYREGESTAINHFYEKLFKLKDLMNTEEGRRIADNRHRNMERFVDQFVTEWDGKDVE